MARCHKCGYEKKILIKCKECKEDVCFLCFVASEGLCHDCFTEAYNMRYKGTLRAYAMGITR